MGYAALMVHAEPDVDAEPRLRLAAGLPDRFGAELIGFASGAPMPPPFPAPIFGVAVALEVLEAEEQRVEACLYAAHDWFHAVLAEREGLDTGWRSFVDAPAQALAREARAAGLLAVGRQRRGLHSDVHLSLDARDMMMRAGRPVLVVPPGASALDGSRVLVAWNDSREARRAVAGAMPFLADAAEVLVVEMVWTGEEREAALRRTEDVALLLRRHGATARGEALEARPGTVADDLLLAADRHGADLIIAGGYAHTQLSEWVFGGVTRSLLARSPKCCLLSH